MVHAQKKGKRGENEFCSWLEDNLSIQVEREYNQASGHSADVVTDNFLFEVKRREVLDLKTWWAQVVHSKRKHKETIIPVVVFRQNRKPWEFLIPAEFIGVEGDRYVRLTERVFTIWARKIIAGERLF